MICQTCGDNGDGQSVFPYYGTAPPDDAESDATLPHLMSRAMWGDNFKEDPEAEGFGVYLRCPTCGSHG